MVCRVCGKPATQTCSKCRQGVAYCDKAHQVADWQAGHRQHCKLDAPDTQARLFGPRFLFKHFDMETELEVLDAEQPLPEATASAPELGAPATPTHGAPSAASAPVLALEKAPSLPTLAKEAFGPNVQVDSLLKEAERADPVWSHFEVSFSAGGVQGWGTHPMTCRRSRVLTPIKCCATALAATERSGFTRAISWWAILPLVSAAGAGACWSCS